VPFESRQWLLAEDLRSTIRGIVCIEGDVAVAIELPLFVGAKRKTGGKFRLERPAVGTQIENFVSVV
jgi:hypothetical protein